MWGYKIPSILKYFDNFENDVLRGKYKIDWTEFFNFLSGLSYEKPIIDKNVHKMGLAANIEFSIIMN